MPETFDYDHHLCIDPQPPYCEVETSVTGTNKPRHRLKWSYNPNLDLEVGEEMFVKFQVFSNNPPSGKLYVDAIVKIKGDEFQPGGIYSWPTAPVVLKTTYFITAKDADNKVIAVLEVVVMFANGEVTEWTIIT